MRRKDIPKLVNKNSYNISYGLLGEFHNKTAYGMVVSSLNYFYGRTYDLVMYRHMNIAELMTE